MIRIILEAGCNLFGMPHLPGQVIIGGGRPEPSVPELKDEMHQCRRPSFLSMGRLEYEMK
jgi:hypothetical protein